MLATISLGLKICENQSFPSTERGRLTCGVSRVKVSLLTHAYQPISARHKCGKNDVMIFKLCGRMQRVTENDRLLNQRIDIQLLKSLSGTSTRESHCSARLTEGTAILNLVRITHNLNSSFRKCLFLKFL